MNNTIIKVEPIEGEWADDALNLYNIDSLLEITDAQGDWAERQVTVEYWVRMARQVGVAGQNQRDILRGLQEYVAVMPPQARCPCKHGVSLARADDHYPHCDNTYAQRIRESAQERMRRRIRELEEQEEALQRRWDLLESDAQVIRTRWGDGVTAHLPTSTLERILEDVQLQLDIR